MLQYIARTCLRNEYLCLNFYCEKKFPSKLLMFQGYTSAVVISTSSDGNYEMRIMMGHTAVSALKASFVALRTY